MRFLVDRCAGRRLADWLRDNDHDVAELPDGPDPGDRALLVQAAAENRVLVTLDADFGRLVFVARMPHAGIVRLPSVPAAERIALLARVLERHADALAARCMVTVRGGRIRISRPRIGP